MVIAGCGRCYGDSQSVTRFLLLTQKPAGPQRKRAHKGRVSVTESNRRWCSDGFEFRCDNGEKLRVTFAQDCCDREIIDWAASIGGYDKETVQDVMLGAVEKRFGQHLPSEPVEWLTDNGSAYRAHETRAFARMLGLEPCTTAVRSPESNDIAESFVKTIKRDYISVMPKPDSQATVMNLAVAFSHYNEHHPQARWDIARHGNIYAESYHNRKREKTSGYIGSNPLNQGLQLF